MQRKLIAFDLDDTLAVTKSPITDHMASLLLRLLEQYQICIITGGRFDLITKHVIDRMHLSTEQKQRFHLMPTCGAQYYTFDPSSDDWVRQYANDLSDADKQHIGTVLEATIRDMGMWEEDPHGELIEDRGSQVTFSGMGQLASPEVKRAWDPDGTKRQQLYERVSRELDGFEVRIDGTTSLNVTYTGIDKGYGMTQLMQRLSLTPEQILFIGDKLDEGGNDYPVKELGIDTIAVERWQDTGYIIEGILAAA